MVSAAHLFASLATISTAIASEPSNYLPYQVRNDGVPVGYIRNISGISTYISPPLSPSNSTKALVHITDIFGLPLLENRLLADSLAASTRLTVYVPDLFSGDAIDPTQLEAGLNLTSWLALHSPEKIDGIIKSTVSYVRNEIGVKRVGAVGYCFGGKYVPRWLKGEERGVDVGFIAHPSNLNEEEIAGVRGNLGIAAGTLDASFNSTAKARAESILMRNNVTFQSNLYAGAPHGFGVRVNQSIPQQAYAKQAAFVQAVTWLEAWL